MKGTFVKKKIINAAVQALARYPFLLEFQQILCILARELPLISLTASCVNEMNPICGSCPTTNASLSNKLGTSSKSANDIHESRPSA